MGSIRWPSNYSSGGTEGVEFIQFVDSQDPQTHKIWRLSFDGVPREVHPTARIDIAMGMWDSL